MGGIVRAIELGFPQKEIAEAAYRYQRQLDRGEKVMVGVNKYQVPEEPPIAILRDRSRGRGAGRSDARAARASRRAMRSEARAARWRVREACARRREPDAADSSPR